MRQAFYSLVRYADYLIYIFININGKIRNKKNHRKIKGLYLEITNISAAHCPKVAHWYHIINQLLSFDFVLSFDD